MILALLLAVWNPNSGAPPSSVYVLDGGVRIIGGAQQGLGYDGGQAWGVYVVNQPSSSAPDHVAAVIDGGWLTATIINRPTVDVYMVLDGGPVTVPNIDVALSTRTKPSDQQHVIVDSSASLTCTGPLTDTQIRATPLPVSGTITATVTGATGTMTCNSGTNLNTSALALDATLTGGTQKAKLVDTGGSTAATVKAASTAAVAADTALVVAQSPNGGNPCQNPSTTLVSIAGATSGTAAVQLIGLSGSTKIYICSFVLTGISGTTPTFTLKYGTGTACATGGVSIVGPWTFAANTLYNFGTTSAFFITPAGQELCFIQTGTSPVANYAITYAQQ